MGVPPFAAYITAAMLCAPAMINLGANMMSAHFFILFLAAIGQITPPVAISCFVAAPLAKASYIKTCLASCKCAFISWLIPFFAIYVPGMLLLPDPDGWIALKILAIVGAVFLGQSAIAGHFFWNPLTTPLRFIHGATTVVLIMYCFWSNLILFMVGIAGMALLCVVNKKSYTVN